MPKNTLTQNPYYNSTKNSRRRQNDQQEITSQKSGSSCKSAREILFQRSNMDLVQSRLSNKNMSRSRLRDREQSQVSQQSQKYRIRRGIVNNQRSSKSVCSSGYANLNQSKNQILNEIAQKLKKRQKIIYDTPQNYRLEQSDQENYGLQSRNSEHYRLQPKRNRSISVKKTKQVYTDKKKSETRAVKTKLSKLQNLLKQIKRSNKQAVFITKRTVNTEQMTKNGSGISTKNKKSDLQQLAQQLRLVKQQLKQVKQKNQQLLSRSQSRSNFDINSQLSSQLYYHTSQISNTQIVDNPYYDVNHNHFAKKDNSDLIIVQNNIQPCFACGCTCRSRNNKLKH